MERPGFRWAPVSLMAAHGASFIGPAITAFEEPALVTEIGLEATYLFLQFPYVIVGVAPDMLHWRVRFQDTVYEMTVIPGWQGPEEYECNMLLLRHSIDHGNEHLCVVVKIKGHINTKADEEYMVSCEYKGVVAIRAFAENDTLESQEPALDGSAGTLKALVT
ncbi:hypothetical protein QBC38DRAFT_152541 [Podospora fimiseda]|uniref:Uncharacterized protein n=1 Tax=Podospora fimiseda TaxID=252190 RepID=A0AAN6YKW6_9PEZI|nr:hypothetical protein QBC38DRAFT_152541 [Podospora fimiseda]